MYTHTHTHMKLDSYDTHTYTHTCTHINYNQNIHNTLTHKQAHTHTHTHTGTHTNTYPPPPPSPPQPPCPLPLHTPLQEHPTPTVGRDVNLFRQLRDVDLKTFLHCVQCLGVAFVRHKGHSQSLCAKSASTCHLKTHTNALQCSLWLFKESQDPHMSILQGPETPVCLFVGCLMSQRHASVSQGQICSDNLTRCHTEIQIADQTFHLTQSQYTDTGPASPSADPILPGAWQGSHWSANF